MSQVANRMEALLLEAFAPETLSILDESARHAGHAGARAGGESHFRLTIEAAAFAGKSRIDRHRMIYAVLQPLFDDGLHALVIDAQAPSA
jgi:BolA protein